MSTRELRSSNCLKEGEGILRITEQSSANGEQAGSRIRTSILAAAVAVILCTLLPGMGMAGDTIKLGVVGAHSGELASYGLPTVNAAKLVTDELNAKGGVNGKKVQLLIQDDMCKPEVAIETAKQLVSQGVDVVLGHVCSGATKAALPIYKAAGVILISPSATSPDLTQRGEYPNFFRTIASDDMQARVEVDYALNVLGSKKIAVIHDNSDYGKGVADFAKGFIEKSGKGEVAHLDEVNIEKRDDYAAIVQKIKQSQADAVIFGGNFSEASTLVSLLRKEQITIPFLSDDAVRVDAFLKLAGKDAEGVYATGSHDNSQNLASMAALTAHRKVYNSDPGVFYDNACSATMAIMNAIEKADSTEIGAVTKAMQTEKVVTPVGTLYFDWKGDAVGVGFSMYQVKNGQYVPVQ